MKNYFEIIHALSHHEFEALGKFLISPIFNTSERLISYYNFLKKNYDKFSENGLSKDEIKSKFFKAKTIEDETRTEINFRKLMSDFNRQFENFLTYLEFERKSGYKKILLLHSLRKRKLNESFESKLSEFEEENSGKKTSDRYYIRKKIKEEAKIYKFSKDYHSAGKFIEEESGALDLYFISEKLELFQNMFSMEYINKEVRHTWKFYKEIIQYIESDICKIQNEEPSIYFNYAMLKLVTNTKDKKLFPELKKFIQDNANKIPAVELKGMAFDLINHCYLKISEGNREYREEMQSLLEFLDRNNLMIPDGNLKYFYFKTAVDNSSSLRKYDWLENFITKYSKFIDDEYRENIKNLALTKLFFFKRDYVKARSFQSLIDYKDYIHYCDAKLVLSCIEFEEGNDEAVLFIIDSLKKYLTKHTDIPENYKVSYKKFVKYLTRLIKCREKICLGIEVDFDLKTLKVEIENEKERFYKQKWLLEKIEELSKKAKKRDRSPA